MYDLNTIHMRNLRAIRREYADAVKSGNMTEAVKIRLANLDMCVPDNSGDAPTNDLTTGPGGLFERPDGVQYVERSDGVIAPRFYHADPFDTFDEGGEA